MSISSDILMIIVHIQRMSIDYLVTILYNILVYSINRGERNMRGLMTPFGTSIDREHPLAEYPRPQLVRDSYMSLNGIWQYGIVHEGESHRQYDGEIVVPYSPETILSGVQRQVMPTDTLYYRREFGYNRERESGRVLLHFDAVDYEAIVTLNGTCLGSHRGGYLPFVFDVTDVICERNVLEVEVHDPSDSEPWARGKQKLKAGGIFYTAQSGIWQSVWLEEVAECYVESMRMTPDIDTKTLTIDLETSSPIYHGTIEVSLRGEPIMTQDFSGNSVTLTFDDVELWSPESPVLYDLDIVAGEDSFASYFAMRKYSIERDKDGYARVCLNGVPYFESGLLDQGYWSDSLMTPPSDSAMIYDITAMKAMGFNMLRKHIKIEPLRWYYHCDRLGMIVWQDFVNGGGAYNIPLMSVLGTLRIKVDDSHYSFFKRGDERGRREYMDNIAPTIRHLYNAPCIAVWVPFNEGWGQFDARRVTDIVRNIDSTRLIDSTSGWVDQGVGDFRSMHIYGLPIRMPRDNRCMAVTEFGGYSLAVEGHDIISKRAFGYKTMHDRESLMHEIERLYTRDIVSNISKGLSACIYTEVSDVENEINGIITFDRAVEKVDREAMRRVNNKVYDTFKDTVVLANTSKNMQ